MIEEIRVMAKLAGKVAIVTGASRGIGRGIAQLYAREGASLLLTARGADALANVSNELTGLGADTVHLAGDVADAGHVDALFALLEKRFGRLDILVNNAGAFDGGPLEDFPLAAWDRVIATNLRGPFLCTRAAMRLMKSQRAGRIINIGSISAQRVRPNSAAYSTSKHGLWGLTQVTALEGREHGITCCCLHPGNIAVERRQTSDKPEDEEPMLSVEDLAEVALLMAALPPHVEMLEAIVLPCDQRYVGRG
jgi:NAD(P)-dependent dehydrogenase (short-subunit alcohol dehydrogenase family)